MSRTDNGTYRFTKSRPLTGFRRAYQVYVTDNGYIGVVMGNPNEWFGWHVGRSSPSGCTQKVGPFASRLEAVRAMAEASP
jgi:hypothetical protein